MSGWQMQHAARTATHSHRTCQEVFPGLYLGSWRAEQNDTVLRENNITHVLQVAKEVSPSHPQLCSYMQLPVLDTAEEDIFSVLPQAHEFIDNALAQGGRVLVHCMMGVSRSVAVVCAYIMCTRKECFVETLESVRRKRQMANPNLGFRLQLQLLEESGWQLEPWGGWDAARYQSESERRQRLAQQ